MFAGTKDADRLHGQAEVQAEAEAEPRGGRWRRLRDVGDSVWAASAVTCALFLLYQAAAGF